MVGLDLPSVLARAYIYIPHFFNACHWVKSELILQYSIKENTTPLRQANSFRAVCRLICGRSSAREISLIDRFMNIELGPIKCTRTCLRAFSLPSSRTVV